MRTFAVSLMLLLQVALLLAGFPAVTDEENPALLTQQALDASRKGDYPQALSLATRVIKVVPKQIQGWLLRARLYDAQGEYAKAVTDYTEVLKIDPKNGEAWQRRGEAHFKSGKIAESVADFDRYLILSPGQKPYHWQRGISLYYLGRFAEGKQQFELHQTVNPQDVENAVWHFLCTARAEGLSVARKQLIPIDKDARVPMAQIHQLFAGKVRPEEVLAAAEAAPPQSGGEPLFYANLYLGIYFEAVGDAGKAREYLLKAAERSKENGYMGDVARVHVALLRKESQALELRGEVVDADTGKPLACRLYLQGAEGTWYFPHSVGGTSVEYKRQPSAKSFEMHTCLSAHPFQITLPPGKYTLTAEHGKEYLPTTLTFDPSAGSSPLRVTLKRWIDMPSRGWYSADTHAHRSPEEMPTLQAAEDVNVAFPLTFWVTKAFLPPAQGDKNQAVAVTPKPVYSDPTHVYWPINTEYELFTVDGKPHTLGAVFALNHKDPLRNGAPPVRAAAEEAHRQGALLELDKHCWEWTMNIVPLMNVDLYDLANNHIWRTEWGVPGWGIPSADYMHIERNAEGWTEAGWIDYGFQNYYALLDCGFNLRPTGGTGTGYHPVPLGWGRVYAHLNGKFSYEAWVKALNEGRSFVTNGPLLMVTVDGKEMGSHFQQKTATLRTYRVAGEAASTSPLDRIEVVVNGKVVRSLPSENRKTPQGGYVSRINANIPIAGSSWLLVRCYESRADKRVRFAHTGPVHISVPGLPLRPRKEEITFLIQRVKDEIARSEGVLPPAALAEYRQALQTYEAIAQSAQ